MEQTIRLNTFETNSSSTHSCCLCSEENFNKWKENQCYYNEWNEVFVDYEQAEHEYEQFKLNNPGDYQDLLRYNDDDEGEAFQSWLRDEGYTTYEDFGQDYESDVCSKEIDGKKIYAICYYGYNG